MNTKESQRSEVLLQQLIGGNSDLRNRALRSVVPKDRERVREILKIRKDADLLIDVLFADLGTASRELRKNYTSQFWRRTAIRALAATVDGIIFSLKQLALATASLIGTSLDEKEREFLSERPISSKRKKVRFLPFRDNLEQTFKLFAKVHGASCCADFADRGFDALCQTFELRHRVMHPKSFMTFGVRDIETRRAGEAIVWLHQELQRLLGASHDALSKRTHHS